MIEKIDLNVEKETHNFTHEDEERVLNIGCGDMKYGTDFVDLYPQRSEVKEVNLDHEKLPYEDNTFDEVFSRCFFEHLKNPGHGFKEMDRVCKNSGKIVVITDNANYWRFSAPKSPHTGGYAGKGYGREDTHYALYTDAHLENFAKDHEREAKITYVSQDRNLKEKFVDYWISRTKFQKLIYRRIKLEAF